MDTENIREFLYIAEIKDLSEAGEALFLSPSTLSRNLRKLEDSLGVQLFTRTSRKMELNEHGYFFLPYAQKIVSTLQEYHISSRSADRPYMQYIRIGLSPTIAQFDYEPIVKDFQRDGGPVRTNIQIISERKLLHMLRNDELDFAFLCTPHRPNSEFSCIQCRSDHIAAVVPSCHPLAQKKNVRLRELKGEPLALLSSDSSEYTLCTDACKKAGFEPHTVITCRFESSILDIVSTGFCIGLLYKSHALETSDASISVIDITPPIFSSIYVLYKENSLSAAGQAYLQHLKTQQLTSTRDNYTGGGEDWI